MIATGGAAAASAAGGRAVPVTPCRGLLAESSRAQAVPARHRRHRVIGAAPPEATGADLAAAGILAAAAREVIGKPDERTFC